MSTFLEKTIERAKKDKKTIVLPESMDRRTFEAAEKVIGKENINPNKPISMGAEDFAYYSLKKPAAQFGIGICPADGKFAPLHNGNFILNEDGLTTAPAIWVQIVLDQMDK